jgi:hypothetical protein
MSVQLPLLLWIKSLSFILHNRQLVCYIARTLTLIPLPPRPIINPPQAWAMSNYVVEYKIGALSRPGTSANPTFRDDLTHIGINLLYRPTLSLSVLCSRHDSVSYLFLKLYQLAYNLSESKNTNFGVDIEGKTE